MESNQDVLTIQLSSASAKVRLMTNKLTPSIILFVLQCLILSSCNCGSVGKHLTCLDDELCSCEAKNCYQSGSTKKPDAQNDVEVGYWRLITEQGLVQDLEVVRDSKTNQLRTNCVLFRYNIKEQRHESHFTIFADKWAVIENRKFIWKIDAWSVGKKEETLFGSFPIGTKIEGHLEVYEAESDTKQKFHYTGKWYKHAPNDRFTQDFCYACYTTIGLSCPHQKSP